MCSSDLKFSVPDHGVTIWIAVIINYRMVRNLDPFVIDRDPIMTLPHLVVGAMPIGDVAARDAILRPHGLDWVTEHDLLNNALELLIQAFRAADEDDLRPLEVSARWPHNISRMLK